MISEVIFDESPIQSGDKRSFRAFADAPMTVQIKCFTNAPPPPGYKACPSCGTIALQSGAAIDITADQTTFDQAGGGELHVTVKDATGDTRDYRLTVVDRGSSSSFFVNQEA